MSGPGAGGGGSGDLFGGGRSVYPPAPPGYKYVDLNIPQAPPGYRVADMKNVANNQGVPTTVLGGNAGLVRGAVGGGVGGHGRYGFAGAHTPLGIQQRMEQRDNDAAMRAAFKERGLVTELISQGLDPRDYGIDMKKYGWTDNRGTGTGVNNIPQPGGMGGGGPAPATPPAAVGSTPGAATPAVSNAPRPFIEQVAALARGMTNAKHNTYTPEGAKQAAITKAARAVLQEYGDASANNEPWDENNSPAAIAFKKMIVRPQPSVTQTPTAPPPSNIAAPPASALPVEVRASAPPSAPPAAAPPPEMKHNSILELLGNMRDNILGHGKPETPPERAAASRDPFSSNPNAAMKYDELGDEGQ